MSLPVWQRLWRVSPPNSHLASMQAAGCTAVQAVGNLTDLLRGADALAGGGLCGEHGFQGGLVRLLQAARLAQGVRGQHPHPLHPRPLLLPLAVPALQHLRPLPLASPTRIRAQTARGGGLSS